MYKSIIMASLCLLISAPVYAQQTITIDPSQIRTTRSNPSREDKKEEELELAADLILKQKRIIKELPNGDNYTSFTFDILSRFETRIKIKWNDENIDYTGESGLRYRLNRNKSRGFTFLAFGPTEGIISIYNEAEEHIMDIPYKVTKQSNGRNSVGFGASSKLGDPNPNLRVNYSHSRRNQSGGSWSFRTSASGKLSDIENINVNLGVNYSW